MVWNGTENISQKFVKSVFYAAGNFLMFSVYPYLYVAPVGCLLNSSFWASRLSVKHWAQFCYCVNSESGLEELKILYLHEHGYSWERISQFHYSSLSNFFLSPLPGNGGCFRKFVSTPRFNHLRFGPVGLSDHTTAWAEWLPEARSGEFFVVIFLLALVISVESKQSFFY